VGFKLLGPRTRGDKRTPLEVLLPSKEWMCSSLLGHQRPTPIPGGRPRRRMLRNKPRIPMVVLLLRIPMVVLLLRIPMVLLLRVPVVLLLRVPIPMGRLLRTPMGRRNRILNNTVLPRTPMERRSRMLNNTELLRIPMERRNRMFNNTGLLRTPTGRRMLNNTVLLNQIQRHTVLPPWTLQWEHWSLRNNHRTRTLVTRNHRQPTVSPPMETSSSLHLSSLPREWTPFLSLRLSHRLWL
jgi:hypothetical protein